MIKAVKIINEVKNQTNSIILFHSGAGKDSIALLDLLYTRFDKVVCVYMYIIKDLEHINKYIYWTKRNYKNIEFIQFPHFAVSSYVKGGFMGIKKNPKQKLYTLSDITERARLKTGIEWVCYGFKKTDSLNRRLMLNGYEMGGINRPTRKFYPLSDYKNGDVLRYIKNRRLPTPINYGGNHQSSGTALTDLNFLLYCKRKFPNDYNKIISTYPETEHKVVSYETRGNY